MLHVAQPLFCGPLRSPETIELLPRPGIALVRCTTIPPDGFHAVPLHAPTVLVHPAKVGLREGLALVG